MKREAAPPMPPFTLPIAPLPTPDAPESAWPARNQQWLNECFRRWADRLANGLADAPPAELPAAPEGVLPAAMRVGLLFGLSPFEQQLLTLAAGVELHAGLRQAVTEAQAAGTVHAGSEPRRARDGVLTFSLALAMLPEPHWDAISPAAPLRRWALLSFDLGAGAAQATVRIDERLLHQLAGVAAFDDALLGIARFDEASAVPAANAANENVPTDNAPTEALLARTAAALSPPGTPRPGPTVLLKADPAQRSEACMLAATAWARLGWRSLRVDADALPHDARELAVLARHVEREAALAGAGITLLLGAEAGLSASAQRFLGETAAPLILVGSLNAGQWPLVAARHGLALQVPAMPAPEPEGLPEALRAALRQATRQFQIDTPALQLALDEARAAASAEAGAAGLWHALRVAARGGLEGLAQRLDSETRLADLVLPAHAMAQLKDIGAQLRLRHQVYGDWGFGAPGTRGLGIAALFTGESGTGKTLAAEAIANEAGLDLFRVDLASTVSKYIGETEKNLARLFDAADASGAVLLFDEADALFGKRSEVKDSHDRYANIEVAYLLQRIESYRGLAILTTNLKGALDRAFLRRLRFVVTFPFPDAELRAQIWQRALPARAPVQGLDFAQLGRIKVAGGSIRNIALGAAFIAAARQGPIDAQCIAQAARAEFMKLERSGADASLEGLA